MRITREKRAQHRAALLEAAGRLFRERGFAGAAVADIARAAGLTHGCFYNHFDSKEALAAEACGEAFAYLGCRVTAAEGDLARYLAFYLSARHRDARDGGCPLVAFGADAARQGPEVAARFADGLEDYVGAVAGLLRPAEGTRAAAAREDRRRRALALVALTAGAVTLARATAEAAPALADELLEAARAALDTGIAGEAG